ncbi:HAMP domain-containing histidine kinase [Pendulispora brunnea]|uniref:histidine kinase n=1 Tax=Pendulispora brunnea TaxID=2905690 RepID=A0ABZ2K3R8_9BACT
MSIGSRGSLPTYGGYTAEGVAFRRLWPLHPLAPAIAIFVSLAVAIAIGLTGLDHLVRESDDLAAERAELLTATLSARLPWFTLSGRQEAIQQAARRTQAEVLIVDENGGIICDASLGAPPPDTIRKFIIAKHGEATTSLGRVRYAVRPLERNADEGYVLAFVRAPDQSEAGPALVAALIALTVLLVGVAAAFAYAVAREANIDVEFLTERVRAMIQVPSEPSGEPVPVRSLDEVGALTAAFNQLVARFVEAEKGYRGALERARAADRDRAAFLAAVSHELRSPLNAILGFADILVQGVDGPLTAEATEEVEQIRASGGHLLELINDILEFSALESGQLRLSRDPVDVVAIATEVLREAAGVLQGRPIVVGREGVSRLVIEADTKRVRQILTNLVANAIKFTQKGEVVVGVALQGAYAKVSVRDTGPGIGDTERALIFEDYRQAGDEHRRKRGTGLGLAIARRLVLLHGGAIYVESQLGRGSTFNVLLPLKAPRARLS